MGLKLANNVQSTLAASLSTGTLTMQVATGEGARFPVLGVNDYFYATLVKIAGGFPVREIIKVTARTGDSMSIVRAQDNTTALTFSVADYVGMHVNVAVLEALQSGEQYLDKGTVSTGTVTFSVAAANVQRLQVGGALTIATSNWPSAGTLGQLVIKLVNGGSAAITWPTINWIKTDGTFTTVFAANGISLQAAGTDFAFIWTDDGGTTMYGKFVR